ncbi:MAG TPA: phenylacetic acid degradation protein [Rhodobacteraceae bacterium]|jgi:phenylacetic acid degradation operon negative regulatory protein|nr:phenylacetic acid degradation protein [Paracoccaceae bacterium]HBV56426.1 phenylacetic acid degradation protein [Paracoccaceae bacterium]
MRRTPCLALGLRPLHSYGMDPLAPLIASLHAEGRLRVWSLVITVFGDCVQHRGGRISTARLQRLLGRIGVEPGALRTALSRLGRDGWVESERAGRSSEYRLSQQGLMRFTEATGRIYAPPQSGPIHGWTLSLDEGGPQGFTLGGLRLRPQNQALPDAGFRLEGQITALSPALRASLISAPFRAALDHLFADLAHLTTTDLDPLDACAARILLIHRWRRIVLRHPDLPAELLPDDLPEPPRSAVARTYARLSPQAEAWLDLAQPDMPAMPSPPASHRGAISRRFAQGA